MELLHRATDDVGDRFDRVDATGDLAGEGDEGLHVAAEVEIHHVAEVAARHVFLAFEARAPLGAQHARSPGREWRLRIRGGALDIFGRSVERQMERRLIGEYETLIGEVVDKLTPQNYELAVDLASVPEYVRGYGHVKERHARDAKVREAALLAQFRAEQPVVPVQAPVAQAV